MASARPPIGHFPGCGGDTSAGHALSGLYRFDSSKGCVPVLPAFQGVGAAKE